MDKWDEYNRWNAAVAEVVFPALEQPGPVYLDFEDDVIEALSTRMSLATDRVPAALAAAVAATLVDGGPAAVFELHMTRLRRWVRAGRPGSPPFLAVLASFCLAAEQMTRGDGMAAHNFFGRLRAVLGWDLEDSRLDQAYRRVAERLWGELNRWLVELDGQRGLPTAYALSHRFVGLTVSQALVRSGDREKLKHFFRQYGFSPGADVAPGELALVLDSWMSQQPCPVSASLERLWRRGQARERIAQAAAVALSSWDGGVRERRGSADGKPAAGHLALTLELGSFPRRRFALQALLYLPQPERPRDATVLTATPRADVELVPDLPGTLSLGRGSSLHAGDVLGGLLRLQDTLTGQVLERRPRRFVLFREDELSKRWVEAPQVMLGDSVRILVHNDLVPRLRSVLEVVARPGWAELQRYAGQPDEWSLFGGVEVFTHPGDLVNPQRMDDLLPLIPLTRSQLKVAGGFSLPGQVRGKWHTWSPPEIRAVSDAPGGFLVRLVDLGGRGLGEDVTETVLGEWQDSGAGVLVQPLAELELEDGDYRVELVSLVSKGVLSTTSVLLRSADSPDTRQWALLDPISYGPGVGVLGAPVEAETPVVRGHLVQGARGAALLQDRVPGRPGWSTGERSSARTESSVRLTIPDADSCVFTGKHREHVDTVPVNSSGKPLEPWSFGRCTGCGLVRRYPTRLKRSTYGRRRDDAPPVEVRRQNDVSDLPAAVVEHDRQWATAFDAMLHTGGGSWAQLERIAFQLEPSALFLDQMARTLEVLGHLDVRRSADTLDPVAWEVSPTILAGTTDGFLFSGFWPGAMYVTVGSAIEDAGGTLAVDDPSDDFASYYANASPDELREALMTVGEDIPVVPQAWEALAAELPPLSEVLTALPRQRAVPTGEITWFQPRDATWSKVSSLDAPGAFRVRRFKTLDVVRSQADVDEGTFARSTVQLSKHLGALIAGRAPLVAYDDVRGHLVVPLGADLPGLYGRALVAASGRPPTADRRTRLLRYADVPPDLAGHVYHLLRS
ncbi:hypothetical protein [Nocardioides perillae]|uniref:Uncharacterized protein n=1 Tax=Nocardioides perillae TaxID=1119534 RepID=A0A7Y9RRF0_9ACTN|nr:hypothetical protein [Nocardioides perillae]NYG54955.1 hypothetical protein [Nocardioides perillae]